MSNPGASKLQTLTITGNPTVDAAIRYGLVFACAGISGVIIGWLNAHGFKDPNITIYVPMGVATVLGSFALSIWGIVKTSKNEQITKLREAIAVAAGINVAESTYPTPPVETVTVASAQKIIADHAPAETPEKK